MRQQVKLLFIFLVAFSFTVLIAGCSGSPEGQTVHKNQASSPEDDALKAHFIDVGQADSILVQLPGKQNILIDAGNNDDADLVINYLRQQGVRRLEHVIGTHPHEDHIGGFDAVIQAFDIEKVYLPRVSHNTKTYEDVLLAIKSKGLKITEARAGLTLDTVSGINAVLLAPSKSSYKDLNNYSAVLKLTYGSTSFLFTGDAGIESEQEMLLSSWQNPKADVLKVGHHGSHSSTSNAFLNVVSPDYAVISVGKDNDYGHPHVETLSRLGAAGVKIFRTDRQGTIVATSNGQSISFNKQPLPNTVSPFESVEIIRIDLEGETVSIKNTGSEPVDLSGWKLVSQKGNQIYYFPAGTVIETGETIKVMSGPGAQAGNNSLVWTNENIWNNKGDPGLLYDADENIVSRFPR